MNVASQIPRPRLGLSFWVFVIFMLGLSGLFAVLGVWQMERLAWKEALVDQVSARLTQVPQPLPEAADWPTTDLESLTFHPVSVTGHYLADRTLLVFTNLPDPKGRVGGPGYWVMTPLVPTTGGTVFVNRGFVPQDSANAYRDGEGTPEGQVTLTGVAVAAETATAFTPAPDAAKRMEWLRDPVRLAKLAGVDGPVFGLTIDAPASPPGALPEGGETVVEFPNNHFGYALTWFGFALLTPCLLAGWVWRQLRPVGRPE
jgi:surfeit locus 1 family protein